MNRSEWLARFFGMGGAVAAPRRQKWKATARKPRRFEFVLPIPPEARKGRFAGKSLARFVRVALTRSEARAMLKRDLGLKRLPAGASVGAAA